MSILAISPVFHELVDDAAVFPPGLAPLPEAVAAHAAHRHAPYGDLVGSFIVGADRLAELTSVVTADLYPDGLPVSVVVPTPASLAEVVSMVDATDRLCLVGLEVKLDPAQDPVDQVRTIAHAERRGAAIYVEVPRPGDHVWPQVADAVAEHGLRLKFRTGGTEAFAFPSDLQVATWVGGAVARRAPFKCTAGLHHALRHTGSDTPGSSTTATSTSWSPRLEPWRARISPSSSP